MLRLSRLREPVNFITHFIPALLSIPAGIYLFSLSDTLLEQSASMIYTLCMVSMFGVSAIYHGFPSTEYGIRFWQKFDHCCIYLMIAGTYTPTALLIFDGWISVALACLVWVIALIGCILKIRNKLKNEILSILIYILMGCLILPLLHKMFTVLPLAAVVWLLLGGVFYVWGTWYYAKDKPLFKYLHSHELWHFFVIFGALSHYIYTVYIFKAI